MTGTYPWQMEPLFRSLLGTTRSLQEFYSCRDLLQTPASCGYNDPCSRVTSSAEERFPHTEEVTGSNPVSPTTGYYPLLSLRSSVREEFTKNGLLPSVFLLSLLNVREGVFMGCGFLSVPRPGAQKSRTAPVRSLEAVLSFSAMH